ncbi:MAG TPA: recombinase family protein [Terriglobales bacterium]|jgi:DNA invertase Pin-like site-specific DNA recombinase
MICAIYARVSTRDKQESENQLIQLREFCAKQEWAVYREYVDRVSGGTADRDAFQRLFLDASQRRFDAVLVWSLDRFSRQGTLPTLTLLNQLAAYGVGFRSFTEPFLDSCGVFRDVVLSLLATLAKQEKIRIRERVCAGLRVARERGVKLGRPSRPSIEIDLAAVRERIGAGQSLRAIALDLGCSAATLSIRLRAA